MVRLSSEPTLLWKILGKIDSLQALASCAGEHAFPTVGCVQGCLFDEIHNYLRWLMLLLKFEHRKTVGSQSKPIEAAVGGRKLDVPEHLDRNGTCRFRQVDARQPKRERLAPHRTRSCWY